MRTLWCLLLVGTFSFIFSGCTNRPLVKGFFNPEGAIYQDSEVEEWGTRSTVKMRTMEF